MNQRGVFQIDWPTIIMYLMIVGIGWMNIYAATYSDQYEGLLDLNQNHGRQLIFFLGALVIMLLVLFLDIRLLRIAPWPLYIISLVSLVAVLLFGQKISGARSWFVLGPIGIQPGEFAKVAAALALANYMGRLEFSWGKWKDRVIAILLVAIPALIILPQPDLGSTIVFSAFIFVFHREGMSPGWIFLGLAVGLIFVLALLFDSLYLSLFFLAIALLVIFIQRKKPRRWVSVLGFLFVVIGVIQSVDYTFNNLLEDRHRNRINILLGLEQDLKGVGYNTHQAQIAIGSGGLTGKGFLHGTQTKYNFVPEQHTDFIFCTVGEEWGLVGSVVLLLLFSGFLMRLIFMAERQKVVMYRVYGYALVSVLFSHFAINIAMAIGLFPVVGIPLPFVSYGGSSLWAFSLMLFIFVKMDAHRMDVW